MSLGSEVLCTADELLGSYALVSQLAAGHLTTLHRAHAAGSSGAALVIKRLLYSHVHELSDRELLLAAGRAGMRVRSPHVVRVLAVHEDPEPFVVMEHVPGVMLSTLLAETLDQEVLRYVFPILVDVLEGLEVLHGLRDTTGAAASLVHGAPSARHVLIGEDGVARLIDLTHATGSGFSVAARRSLRLLPAEMAPEQVLAPMHVDARCDLFIVGTVLWRALTGQELFAHAQREEALEQLLRKPILTPSEAGSPLGKGFDRICLRALSRTRAERYASAAEMARELKAEAERASLYASREEIASLVQTLALANKDDDEERALVVTAAQVEDDANGVEAPESAREHNHDATRGPQPVSDAAEALDVLTIHHQDSSRFGFRKDVAEVRPAARVAQPSLAASAAVDQPSFDQAAVTEAIASISDSVPCAEERCSDGPVLRARGPARSDQESGSWHEGLPSILPNRDQPHSTAPFWLWGIAAAAVSLGSVLIDNPLWWSVQAWSVQARSVQTLREQPVEALRAGPGRDDTNALGSGNYADFFASPRSRVASSALPPRASESASSCIDAREQDEQDNVESQGKPAPVAEQADGAPGSAHTVSTITPAPAAPRARATKRFLSPLPPNPY